MGIIGIIYAIQEAFERARKKNWDYIVVLVDIHGTIFEPCWDEQERFKYYPDSKAVLQEMTKRNDIKMVLWSSCYPDKIEMYRNKLKEDGIVFDYVNEFPEAENTSTGCFDQKMFFNVGIDNAFGFNPFEDWHNVMVALDIYGLNK